MKTLIEDSIKRRQAYELGVCYVLLLKKEQTQCQPTEYCFKVSQFSNKPFNKEIFWLLVLVARNALTVKLLPTQIIDFCLKAPKKLSRDTEWLKLPTMHTGLWSHRILVRSN